MEQDIPDEKKKEDIKKLLTKFMDIKHLEMSYDGLINETVSDEDLAKAILSYRKKTAASKFVARQWKLLKDGKLFLTRLISKRVCKFLISLNQLFEEYPAPFGKTLFKLAYWETRFLTFHQSGTH